MDFGGDLKIVSINLINMLRDIKGEMHMKREMGDIKKDSAGTSADEKYI